MRANISLAVRQQGTRYSKSLPIHQNKHTTSSWCCKAKTNCCSTMVLVVSDGGIRW